MQRGWLRVMVRYPLVVLVEQGRLTQREAARQMGLSVRQVRRVLRRYRESGGRLESLAYQRQHPAPNALSEIVRQEIRRLYQEYPHWSAPAIAEALAATEGVSVHRATVHRLIRQEKGNPLPRQRRPARRFEMHAFGELWQMDTTVGAWLEGYRRICVVTILDDYSRAVVAARVFPTDSSYHSLLALRQAMERYGRPRVLYTDNDSKFRLTRYQRSRFYIYRDETLEGLVETEVGRALRELDVQLLSHFPGNAQAKGKIERFFRFLQERLLDHNQAGSLQELQALVDRWVTAYNAWHVHRAIGCTPAQRLQPSVTRPLQGNADDIFCLKEERKVAKDHTITLDGVTYTLPSEPCLVAFKVQLHIHPAERIRVWHGGALVAELPHIDKTRLRDAPLTVEQVLEDILPATENRSF
jgi:transposase InsO family protein